MARASHRSQLSAIDKSETNIIQDNHKSHSVRKMKGKAGRKHVWSLRDSTSAALPESNSTRPDHRRHSSAPSSNLFTLIEEPELNRWNSAAATSMDNLDNRRIDAAPILRRQNDSPQMNESLAHLSLDDTLSSSKIDLALPFFDAVEPNGIVAGKSQDINLAPKTSDLLSRQDSQSSKQKLNEPIGNENTRDNEESSKLDCA